MRKRKIREGIYFLGAPDWERRLFDSLIPLPYGTSYNAYLIEGREKTVLLDTVDPSKREILLAQLEGVERIDYIVSHHAEQDHSGCIPDVLDLYRGSRVITTPAGRTMLMDLLRIPADRIQTVTDGETLPLGGRTLEFIYTPWVHWPETMSTYLKEERILFSCDFFGSHLATSRLYAGEEGDLAYREAKVYYATIMMPYHRTIAKNLEKLKGYEIEVIAPSHGPLYETPSEILERYREWVSGRTKDTVLLPYVSMHGSTKLMVEYLTAFLAERGIEVRRYDLTVSDPGSIATDLVDAKTMVIGSPVILGGLHPHVAGLLYIVNLLRPKLEFLSFVGSYGWASRVMEQVRGMVPNLKVEFLEPVLSKGLPGEKEIEDLKGLAERIHERHKQTLEV